MWSQWVWLMKRWRVSGRPWDSRWSVRPSSRIPVPASKMRMSGPHRTSTHAVLPPKRLVRGPGAGIEPRVPQKVVLIGARVVAALAEPALDQREELVDLERLHDVVGGAQGPDPVPVGLVGLGRHRDDDRPAHRGIGPDLLDQLEAVHLAHHEVG